MRSLYAGECWNFVYEGYGEHREVRTDATRRSSDVSEADIRLPETVVYALPAGHYFLRVRATNASGYPQDAFDYYVMETGKAYGMKSFFVETDGSVTEDLYEE